jgi:hypothetical protein
VLLDRAKQKVLQHFEFSTWEDLRQDHTIQQLADIVSRRLANIPDCPSRDAIQFLCSYNNVRREGNSAAHTATLTEIRDAVMTKPLDTQERMRLEQVFRFTFNEDV